MERPFQSMVFLRPRENKWAFQKPFFNGNVPLPEVPWVITSCHQNGTLLCVGEVRRRRKPGKNIFVFHHTALGNQRNFWQKYLLFSSFLSEHPREDKGAGGETLGKKEQLVGFLTRSASLAIGPEGPLSHRTCWLSLYLVDEFSGLQWLYRPRDSFCATSINADPGVFMHALSWSWQGSFSGRFLWLCSPLCWYLYLGAVHWLVLI